MKSARNVGAACAVIIALAFALMIPAITARPMVHDSFWIDYVWIDQFTAEIRRVAAA